MTEVFELIFDGIISGYHILKNDFVISAWGFSFSLWDFLLTLFILSFIVPLVVAPDHTGSFFNITRWFSRNSERNDRSNTELVHYYDKSHKSSSPISYRWHTRK